MKGTLKKLEARADAMMPSADPSARAETTGIYRLPPQVGRRFQILLKEEVTDDGWLFGGSGMNTSIVSEIVSETAAKIVFKTLNSVYELSFGADA